jgi:methylase of polypeptide subunit release factors
MGRSLIEEVYARCVPGSRSVLRAAHRKIFRSPLIARAVFGVRIHKTQPDQYVFDLTSVLLRGFLRRRLRRSPHSRVLEIGTGPFALPSAALARYTVEGIDAVELDEGRVASARRTARENDAEVRVARSDLFESVPEGRYDLIFWNLPYYQDPEYLERLFEAAPDHLAEGGELVLGYNATALPGGKILGILARYASLRPAWMRTWRWNRHEILVVRPVASGGGA